jgi:uncharacterized phage protein (TIGR01671 family)
VREIKFRGKNNGKWVYGNLVIDNRRENSCYCSIIYFTDAGNDFELVVDPTTVGQYIGLHDKNGKEIFEGDIVKWGHINGEESPIRIAGVKINPDIQFCSNVGVFRFGCFAYQDTENHLEIIGNIHDNPELLNSQKQKSEE